MLFTFFFDPQTFSLKAIGGSYDQFIGGDGIDTLNLSQGIDIFGAGSITGGNSVSGIETIYTGGGNDQINMSGISESLQINGDDGDDTLTGGSNNDTLAGGSGNDRLTGGNGQDTFVATNVSGSQNIDTVTDFTTGSDKLDLSAYHFAVSNQAEFDVFAASHMSTDAAGNTTLSLSANNDMVFLGIQNLNYTDITF